RSRCRRRRRPPRAILLPYTTLFRSLEQMRAARRAERDEIEGRLEALRLEEAEARLAFAEVEDEANLLAGQIAALEALERDHHGRSEEHTSELQSREKLVCRLLLEKK